MPKNECSGCSGSLDIDPALFCDDCREVIERSRKPALMVDDPDAEWKDWQDQLEKEGE